MVPADICSFTDPNVVDYFRVSYIHIDLRNIGNNQLYDPEGTCTMSRLIVVIRYFIRDAVENQKT